MITRILETTQFFVLASPAKIFDLDDFAFGNQGCE